MQQRRFVIPMVILACIASAMGCLLADEENTKTAIQPRLADTTLSVAGRKINSQRVQDSWRYEHSVVDLRISIDGDKVIATQAQTGKPAWKAPAKEASNFDGWQRIVKTHSWQS